MATVVKLLAALLLSFTACEASANIKKEIKPASLSVKDNTTDRL